MQDNRFGSDILVNNGDIVVSPTGDLFTTDDSDAINSLSVKFPGYYNMLYSLLDRLNTVRGSNHFHPDYGSKLHELLSSPNDASFVDYVSREIEETILQDPRVSKVESVVITQSNDTISARVSATLIGSEQSVEFVFPNFITA